MTRVAVVERTLEDHDKEIELARERWHAGESDRKTLQLLVDGFKTLNTRMEEIAAKAATAAVDKYMKERDENERKNAGVRLDRVAIVITVLGLAASIFFQARG